MRYLLESVSRGEYEALRQNKLGIISGVLNSFNEEWKPKVQGVEIDFKYNHLRYVIGIFVKGDKKEQLILDSENLKNLNEGENVVVRSLHLVLQQRLDDVRIRGEAFV